MCANHTPRDAGVVKRDGEAGPGLVPYTTSDTPLNKVWDTPDYPVSDVLLQIQAMPTISARQSRLLRLKHHVRTASRLIKETMARGGRKWRAVFVTLTYKPGVEWSARHITGYIKNVRMWAKRRGSSMGYVWVAEMQKRGAVHYHAVIWIPASLRLPRPDKVGWWRHGSSNVQAVKRNAIGYLMKYVSKGVVGNDPDMPPGSRVCGSGGLDAMARDEFHYWRLPRYVRQNIDIGDRCCRVEGGGWMSRRTGEVWRSDWGLYSISRMKIDPDCNGNFRRSDVITRLSDVYKREKSPFVMNSEVVDMVFAVDRENYFYAQQSRPNNYENHLAYGSYVIDYNQIIEDSDVPF